jgi:small-conductance mechanosensitive channel
MDATFHHHAVRTWLIAGAVALGSMLLLLLVRSIATGRLAAVTQRTTNVFDDVVLEVVRRTRILFIAIVSIYAGSLLLADLPELERTIVERIAILTLFVQVALWATSAISFGVARYREKTLETDGGSVTTMAAFGVLGRIAIWIVLLLAILQNFGVQITALITGLGIGGIAVALAVQNILGDVLASLSIVLDKPFVIGDFLIVGDVMGTVEHVGLKTTRLRSLSGEQLVLSNNDLLQSRIRNYKRMKERRVVFTLGVTYETPVEKLELIPSMIKEAVALEGHCRFDRCHFFKYGDSSLDFEIVYYVDDPDYNLYMDIQQRLNLFIFKAFAREGIGFAYPTRTLYLQQASWQSSANGSARNSPS